MGTDPSDTAVFVALPEQAAAPFVLCAILGTLETMRAGIWPREAGIWTSGRPVFLEPLGELPISGELLDVLRQADEIEGLSESAALAVLVAMITAVRTELAKHTGQYWYARIQRAGSH